MNSLFESPSPQNLLIMFLLYLLIGVVPLTALLCLIYKLFTAPLRRNEQARLFLDLLEHGLRNGQSLETTVVEAAKSGDEALGKPVFRLAQHVQAGLKFDAALGRVPALLPAKTRATLQAGQALGSIPKVIPAARESLRDATSAVRSAMNYLVLLLFVITPVSAFIPLMFMLVVLPKYKQVFFDMIGGMQLPAFTRLVLAPGPMLFWFQTALVLFFWSLALAYILGPKLRNRLGRPGQALLDRVDLLVPWRRKRVQRDFSIMLTTLLDAEVPESQALDLAARSTANSVVQNRAARAQALLAEGNPLPEALRVMDGSAEFHWRLTNALHGGGNFARALAGWHETLDARAFQLEQTAAQITTTGLVLLNGLVVGSIVIAVFLVLVSILHHATLW
jgi:type II secretory pathway component PulF